MDPALVLTDFEYGLAFWCGKLGPCSSDAASAAPRTNGLRCMFELEGNRTCYVYAIPCSRYRSIIGKYMDGRAQIKEDVPESTTPKLFKKFHGEVVFYANGLLCKDLGQGFLRLGEA